MHESLRSSVGEGVIADLLDHPQAEIYTNPASRALAARYFDDVGRYEAEGMAAADPPRR